MRLYQRGSEWRKWDLHVHAPGTKFNDQFGDPPDWDSFCGTIEKSDVAVVGITDYFSLDSFFGFSARYKERHPNTEKVFFPNLELRLNESVNKATELVHIHAIFRPDVEKTKIDSFLSKLAVQHTTGDGRKLTCSELSSKSDFESATVSRDGLRKAVEEVFGDAQHAADSVLLFVPANNDGIRADDQARKRQIADEIERQCQALFGSASNRDFFLQADRYEAEGLTAVAKPVFGGSDAHSQTEISDWLGKAVDEPGCSKAITWVKADPTFEGLQQTLVEPAERVRIQPTKPDAKEPYKVITAVHFSGTDDFPETIEFNQNLVSIIGSRSSGKSALLAYMAHAVDPIDTERQQRAVEPLLKPEKLGPAAGITWDFVKHIECVVEWGASAEHSGHVIYIPQNSLYALSGRADEITAKIEPTIFRLDPAFEAAHRKVRLEVDGANEAIRSSAAAWFQLSANLSQAQRALRELGDKAAITETQSNLVDQIAKLRADSSLTAQESADYQNLVDRLGTIDGRLRAIDEDSTKLGPYIARQADASYVLATGVRLEVHATPNLSELPTAIVSAVQAANSEAVTKLTAKLEEMLVGHQVTLDSDKEELKADSTRLRTDNAALIAKNAANAEIEALVKSKQKQDDALKEIATQETEITQVVKQRDTRVEQVSAELARRDAALKQLKAVFSAKEHSLDLMRFGLEQEFSSAALAALAERFNKHERGPLIDRDTKHVKIQDAHSSPGALFEALWSEQQKVIQGEDKAQLAADVLTLTPETRFYGELEGDRIGGFKASSMTPGKQALFALTLILNESDDAWPLLIDQPEDDLDSRSIYDVLVGYLMERKKERQIIMVSHNANLVIGADSEQVIVANRHGADRKNRDEREFGYLTGSLDHSQAKNDSPFILPSRGIREHACELLDGGEEAFRKRRDKYKL